MLQIWVNLPWHAPSWSLDHYVNGCLDCVIYPYKWWNVMIIIDRLFDFFGCFACLFNIISMTHIYTHTQKQTKQIKRVSIWPNTQLGNTWDSVTSHKDSGLQTTLPSATWQTISPHWRQGRPIPRLSKPPMRQSVQRNTPFFFSFFFLFIKF